MGNSSGKMVYALTEDLLPKCYNKIDLPTH